MVGYNWEAGGGKKGKKPKSSLLLHFCGEDGEPDARRDFSCTVAAGVVAAPPDVGALVTVSYLGLSKKGGVPRHPNYKGERVDLKRP